MQILHSSDLHARLDRLLAITEPFDLWLDTGDFFPNRPDPVPVDADAEVAYQRAWAAPRLDPLRRWLDGRPVLTMPGNHDFASLAALLQDHRIDATEVAPRGVTAHGLRWAGFRHVPLMDGHWPGETDDFEALVHATVAVDPHVIVTHGPPAGILDGTGRFGIAPLGEAVHAASPTLQACFFGHEHDDGGSHTRIGRVDCYNGAERARIVALDGTTSGP